MSLENPNQGGNESMLTTNQIDEFARTVAMISDTIEGFYSNPENEKAFQDWYLNKYGHHEKESGYE